jgi:hydroxymethylglutaryl-CoA reductase
MAQAHIVNAFSKMSRDDRINWIKAGAGLSEKTIATLNAHLHSDSGTQDIYEDISENAISNFHLPLRLAPNFLINGNLITLPMVIEESSVVAAASHAAKFWAMHGGFHCEVRDQLKVGQIHFNWRGSSEVLQQGFKTIQYSLISSVRELTQRMEQRGGGINSIELRQSPGNLKDAYQLFVTFRTAEAMGANFINTVLEALALRFRTMMLERHPGQEVEIIMSILSNYTPECLVSCSVEANPEIFSDLAPSLSGRQFAEKFTRAVDIASCDPYRAVTHNKGIYNGMDAVLIATGNDYRAAEACGHAYASRNGSYSALSKAQYDGGKFSLSLEVPMAVGTLGGLTSTHPLASAALEILGNPTSEELMQMIGSAGLASNFSAVRALITGGIQQGHMKMHLGNILRQLKVTPEEHSQATGHFSGQAITHNDVSDFLITIRKPGASL